MIFHAIRCYSIKNLFVNGDIVHSRELKKYRTYKESNNIYIIRKNNAKRKKLRKI